jgi:hypothetical protein
MTFEEFEKWAQRMQERHEALAGSLDIHKLQGKGDALTSGIADRKTSVGDLKAIAEVSLQNINVLAGIAENHERRITRLEGG